MRTFLRQMTVAPRPLWSPVEEDEGRGAFLIDPASLGPIVYLNSTIGLAGAHNSQVATWPDQSGSSRDAAQPTAGQRPLLQTTSNLSPLGRQMVLFGGVSPNAANMFYGTDLPNHAGGGVTIIAYGKAILTGLVAGSQCYPMYAAQTGDRPDTFVRIRAECIPGGGTFDCMAWQDTTTNSGWVEFVIEDQVHRMWVWRFEPPEGAGGTVTAFRGNALGLVKGTTFAFGWGWTESAADGYVISRVTGNAGWRGTIGTVIRYHAALTDLQLQGLYNWHAANFGFN